MRACSGHPWAYYSGPEGEYRVCRECGRVEAGSEETLRRLGRFRNAGIADFSEQNRSRAETIERLRAMKEARGK